MGGIISGLFGGGKEEAYKHIADQIGKGMEYYKGNEQGAEKFLSPYLGDPRLQRQYEQTIAEGKDYQGLLDKIMGGYKQSDYAKYLTETGSRAIQHQGAASGLHGSTEEERNLQQNAMGIASGDMQQYLQNTLGLRSDYLGRLSHISDIESGQQFKAREKSGDWRMGLGKDLLGAYASQGEAQGAADMARANQYQNIFGAALNMVPGIGGIAGDVGKYIFSGGSNNPFSKYSMG